MKLKIYQIDAFTDTVFKGNYAAVIILKEWLSTELMQQIATENNLSETAFVFKNTQNIYEIRWFSPITEIDFCGHATLAAAFVIFKENVVLEKIIFTAKAVGDLSVEKLDSDYIQMSFPNRKPKVVDSIPQELLNGLSITPKEVLLNQQAYFAIFSKEEDVYSVKTNLNELKKLAPYDVVVTSKSTEYDFISRYFWPANGGEEDPVTGSIHTGLAPYWAEKLNKNELIAHQASKRGGLLKCKVLEDKVIILGQAVLYLEGYITI
ncbi:phenazine biosynthesis protein PhzF [Arcobacter suis]|uniref:Epimerase, PhzC/PhzF family n=1 Tax=Arcobacter suis CECT 7833 TaxID=663365 RepID=A0AAD0SR78_9BACT|nr:PhzF family phenazine biosynthesis protein [Arcobacter suis]AXX89584.1 epimerase, PhzC/PhzF family [Arcobacter suis CECT 7833]RWS46683.1 phenazine biosynthesis protein PhzF [Arcobacter suis]